MTHRRTEGTETWHRLLEWDRSQAPAERLAALILRIEEYLAIDPSHPLGGPDGLKDAVCDLDGRKWVVSVFFPRGQKSFLVIKTKFENDLKGVARNEASGIVFVTNQEMNLSEREELVSTAGEAGIDIFHLERICSILNSPACYGMRLDFLDIEMTKEEQLAFVATRDAAIERIQTSQNEILQRIEEFQTGNIGKTVPAAQSSAYVTPVFSNSYLTSSLYRETLHRCSNCGYGYFITRPDSSHMYIGSGEATITCPNCGNVEKYTGISL